MSSIQCLREFINERLTAAAEEIFRVFQTIIVDYEEEIDRQRRLLDIVWKPEIKLQRIELLQQNVCEEEEVLTDQQPCNQEKNSSLAQEDPEPPQIKEEQEEVYTSLEGEQLVLKQETETFMWTPTCEESDNSEDQTEDSDETESAAEKEHVVSMLVKSSVVPEPNSDDQLLSHNSHVAESQDHKGGKLGDSGSTRNAETEPKKRHHRRKNPTNNEDNSTTSKLHSNIYTGKKSLKCNTYGKAFKCKSNLNKHLRVHTELLQQHVCEEEEVLTDQQLCNQEKNSSLDQEDPEPPQIKEEQAELCTSLEGAQLVLKQETETFMLTPTCKESDNSEDQTEDSDEIQNAAEKEHVVSMLLNSSVVPEPSSDDQLLSHNSHVVESQDHKGSKHGDSGSTGNAETKPKKRHQNTSKTHSYIYTGKKSLKNNTCGKAFKCKSYLNKHLRVHAGEKSYNCETCGKGFGRMSDLKKHMRIHTGEKPYPCNTCEKRFSRRDILQTHMRVHTGEKPYPCNTCEKRFPKTSALKAHMRVHTGEKPYPCNTCEKRFPKTSALKAHMRVHTGEKPYPCNTCEKRFSELGNLKRHMRTHTGEKPYTCNTCEKIFSELSALKQHMRVHTGEKPYTCNTCEKRFPKTSALKAHMRVHTGEKPYPCNTCEKRFSQLGALNLHMRVHTGEKPYSCKTCGKDFPRGDHLKIHMRAHSRKRLSDVRLEKTH
ncbi:zinc finger protein 436-like isoform X2 [Thunnus maccoyii]|uniref:zinc finger protein 436-like isoform X2 n=1 Tax=Thunnus maccoyii TaxID=8240 RepID=UPI001C4B2B88|nr:zinc finger protein 436-like isoform X2 [Thunnus maccoyii]